ncbi:hypothetical protein LEP1GSC185_3582 [Leptospira licerasiae serovar Varillal str. VAR 010]|uniref:Uncharacterized protein n=1 Tax=Leptospira licerasiae str. MMD4847 TaxID=1049971 RepID=A0ABN0HE74_9LEPT|nr:hypothetical protein LEP1GSC185_3582 [Leptospira licerasiae serovar Varillal str. VAR 010]EJZ43836.1 hypothetical protein LEP1GSC178_2313 [Leptospira licerasiae str. MMD4847]
MRSYIFRAMINKCAGNPLLPKFNQSEKLGISESMEGLRPDFSLK